MLKEQTKQIDGQEIIKTYIECPHCKQQYVICYDNHSTLVLKKQIRRIVSSLKMVTNEEEYKRSLKKVEKKQNRLKREMDKLETKYNKHFKEGN